MREKLLQGHRLLQLLPPQLETRSNSCVAHVFKDSRVTYNLFIPIYVLIYLFIYAYILVAALEGRPQARKDKL